MAISRLPASTSPAKGVLFTNPGGPGGAGVDLPLLFVSAQKMVKGANGRALIPVLRDTGLPIRDWTALECGNAIPAAAYAYWVSPEQSKAFGPAAAQT